MKLNRLRELSRQKRAELRFLSIATIFAVVLCTSASAQMNQVLCTAGSETYAAKSHSGVKVVIGPDRANGFSTRSCAARLEFNGKSISVAANSAQVDLDMFDATMDSNIPVAAFQVKQSATEWVMEYVVYTLKHEPRLLFSITGGSFFSAADVDLDGRIEIWTDDAAAVNNFDGISLAEFDLLPTYVLRYSGGALHDVSPEFTNFYDDKITALRTRITPDKLDAFRNTDGQLKVVPGMSVKEIERLHFLRSVKIPVLEIVWSYLYSGREEQAWNTLAEMWPASDRDRVRQAILNARDHGMRTQLATNGQESSGRRRSKRRKPESVTYVPPQEIAARPIMTRIPYAVSALSAELVIDAAGKVRTADASMLLPGEVRQFIAGWKFIPAWRGNHSVASRQIFDFSPLR